MGMARKADAKSKCREENEGVKSERGRRRLGEKRRKGGRADNEFRQKERGRLHYK